MNLSSVFIRRPVLSIVTNMAIVLFGLISFSFLGVRDYPAVDPPVISVRTSYGGANAEIIESQITEPLEEAINGISGIKMLTSSSSDGNSSINVEFNLGVDMEAAANDVRDRVARARHHLPDDVEEPAIIKADANAMPVIMITLGSDRRTPIELTDYANNIFKEQLQTIDGVSEVRVWGEKRYAIRLWLDPGRMTACGLTPQDVQVALKKENIELPSGKVEGASTELTLRTMGTLKSVDDFNNLMLREVNGQILRLRDIGTAVEGIENEKSIMKRNGVPMIGIALVPLPGANHIAIANEFYQRLERLKKDVPADIRADIGFDITKNIRTSIKEVLQTIALAFALVVMVIFIFLRTWRATLIPMLAMPISLIGAFFVMYLNGFSINILTLLGIVLATGLVVDDAIVVLENIYQKIEKGEEPHAAGHRGSAEIFFAIISTTLAIISVILPIIFMQGMTGRLFREFGTVVAGSVIISAFVSLTLTPMLCTRFLHRHNPGERSLYAITEPFFATMIRGYRSSLGTFLSRRVWALVIMAGALVLIVVFYAVLPTEMAPLEDRSRLSVSATGAEGASYDYMLASMDNIGDVIRRSVPEAAIVTLMTFGSNSGSGNIMLVDPGERKRTQAEIALSLTRDVKVISAVRTFVTQEQTIGRRGGWPVQYVIQTGTLEKLREKVPLFFKEASASPLFQTVDVNMKFNKPELQVLIDREKARDLGVSVLDISQVLQLAMTGGTYDYFMRQGKQYSVIGQFSRQDRNKPLDVMSLYVKNKDGDFIQLDNLVTLKETSNPPQLYHFNRSMAATFSANLAPGRTLGEGIEEMQAIGKKVLDESFTTALAGAARDFAESSSNLIFTFLFALILVYLVLAAQFESFRYPFIVMFTVPLALAGGFLSLWYFNQTLNIFSQIGIIMLVGLVTKNGILIVEFSNQRRAAGLPLTQAVVEAAASRLRPIVMTSLTVTLGVLPIALALGAGAKSRMSLGIVIIGGILFSLVLSLYVVPVMYVLLSLRDKKTA